jgi:prepilin-type N-terminal cleavage/methylation domain-containing protein
MIKKQDGFTLIEVLIAITLLSAVMIGIITLTDNTFDTADRVIREDKERLALETAFSRMEWDLSQLYSPLYFSHQLKPEGMSEDEGEIYNSLIDKYQRNPRFNLLSYNYIPIPLSKLENKTTLSVFTNANRRNLENLKQSNFAWIQYSLESNDEEVPQDAEQTTAKEIQNSKMLIRKIQNSNIYDSSEIEWDKVKSQILFRKVNRLKYEFWNKETDKWTDNLDLIKNGANHIRGIRITMDYFDQDNLEKKTVRIFRPLYPDFEPEDMYKFLNGKPKPESTDSSQTESNSTTSSDDSEGSQGEAGDD